jgi:hypothetical protein
MRFHLRPRRPLEPTISPSLFKGATAVVAGQQGGFTFGFTPKRREAIAGFRAISQFNRRALSFFAGAVLNSAL